MVIVVVDEVLVCEFTTVIVAFKLLAKSKFAITKARVKIALVFRILPIDGF